MKKSIFIVSAVALFMASCSSDDDSTTGGETALLPVDEAVVAPFVGGANEPNQVFVDLSSAQETSIQRDSWDLGFYSGSEFRVILNGSIKMAVKQLNTTDITEVQEEDASVSVGYTTLADLGYVDNPTGILTGAGNGEGTAIAEVSDNDEENKVYLVNLGYEVGTTTPEAGSVALDGEARGWKKIRITKQGNDYVLQYADLDATTAQSVTISKNANYNFVFVSLTNGQTVNVEPESDKWDLNFTGFTNYYPYGTSQITYYFSDFITTNIHGGTQVYEVVVSDATQTETTYADFALEDVEDADFWVSITDQRVIGSNWRNGGGPSSGPSIKDDRFYVVKDTGGNIYKLRLLALTNDNGVRGYPVFEYELL
ncbi:HmuY family protein [Flavobacterium sp. NRK F10]|uniref:HmuY family protein n=1 Tax=Flavobacterium sp. NRK F10 TaxID=2954931 RepID=UPI0020908D70|nr:HmuY family protein [Flavobacterium sp. NRK F10]MCO6175045.1 HmuY family protein [Flavobacterium sp. NRK F10]